MRAPYLCLISICTSFLLSSGPAVAQTTCPEGKMLSGVCADAPRAEALRRRTIVFTQPKLSFTGPPVPLGAERRYEAVGDRQLGLQYELFGPAGVGTGGVPCGTPRC